MTRIQSNISYIQLLTQNPNFRRLWYGQVISHGGDWFNSIAIYTFILETTGSNEKIGLYLIARLLPMFFMGPVAGIFADRFSRKKIMILLDILRGIIVLGFLLVREPGDIWMIYTLTVMQVVMSAVFEPARTASVPTITSRGELLAANALSGITWSVMLAVGGMLGGFVAALFGREAAFIIDSITYFISALFIYRVQIPFHPRSDKALNLAQVLGLQDLKDGFNYIRQHTKVLFLLSVKFGNGLAGGAIVIVAVFGQQFYPIGGSAAAGMGVLHAAWGLGSALGPSIARYFVGENTRLLRWSIGPAFLLKAVFFMYFAYATHLEIAFLALIFAFGGGSILWIFSTTLLHLEVPDRFRGRVFAAEFALLTLSMSVSNYATGYVLDYWHWSPRFTAALLGAVLILPAIFWTTAQFFWKDEQA